MKRFLISIILTIILVLFVNSFNIIEHHKPIVKTEIIEKEVLPPKIVALKPEKVTKVTKPKPIAKTVKPTTTTVSRGAELNQDEVILLAKLIQSEALAESYEGKLWVGAVVINRMRVYDKSLSEVIYQKSQFSGIHSKLFNSTPSKNCIKAAEEILSGNLPSREVLYFVNLNLCNPSWIKNVKRITRVGSHTFYKEK